jgi:hypothetical protein
MVNHVLRTFGRGRPPTPPTMYSSLLLSKKPQVILRKEPYISHELDHKPPSSSIYIKKFYPSSSLGEYAFLA